MAYLGARELRASQSRLGFAGLLLLAGLLLWTVTAWPLPRFFSKAIPHTNLNTESQTVRPIASGDHLQLLYHFWLGLDALSGHSPLFHNVYEFNLGDDAARVPARSLLHAVFAGLCRHRPVGGARRRLECRRTGLGPARRAVHGPPRPPLHRLAGGGPAGHAGRGLVSLPLDHALHGLAHRFCHGFSAAAVLWPRPRHPRSLARWAACWRAWPCFFAYTTDLHVFYFSALAAPFLSCFPSGCRRPRRRQWPARDPRRR